MAFQPVPDTAQVFVEFSTDGQAWGNTHYFTKDGGYTSTDLQNLADDIDSWVATEFLPQLHTGATYVKTTARGLATEEDYEVTANAGTGAGEITGNPMPNNAAWVAKRISGFTGRAARGRIYIGGLGLNHTVSGLGNHINSTSITAFLTALLEIVNYAVTHGWVEVIVSRWNNGVKRTQGATLAVSDWDFTDSLVDTQRKRLS